MMRMPKNGAIEEEIDDTPIWINALLAGVWGGQICVLREPGQGEWGSDVGGYRECWQVREITSFPHPWRAGVTARGWGRTGQQSCTRPGRSIYEGEERRQQIDSMGRLATKVRRQTGRGWRIERRCFDRGGSRGGEQGRSG
jgi:hypothetical protein